jgi:hypothetical protein
VRGPRWLLAAAAIGLLGGSALVVGPSTRAEAAPLVSFRSVAGSDGMRQVVTRPDAPLSSQVVDAGLPSTQTAIDNLGNSQAYGSFLYPGETVLSGPGLVSGVIGQSLPGYPIIAASSDPSVPSSDASQGPLQMKASSTPTSSTATSSFASPQSGVGRLVATAKSDVDPSAGSMQALSTSEATGVDVAGVLRLSSVRSSAKAAFVHGATTAPSSSLEIGETSVAGVRVVLTPQGLSLPGQTLPLPDGSPVLKPLSDAGVVVELVAPEKLPGGIRSGGVRVTTTQDTPDGDSATVSYTFGQSYALVTGTVDQSLLVPTVTEAPSAGPTAGGTTGSTGGVVTPPVGPGPPIGSEPPPAVAGPLPSTGSVAPPQVSGPSTPVALSRSTLPFARMDSLSFYLVLVLAGAVTLAAQQALRRFGVSSTWTS